MTPKDDRDWSRARERKKMKEEEGKELAMAEGTKARGIGKAKLTLSLR